VLILADLVQVATLWARREASGSWRLAGVKQVRWRHYVQPGDRMDLDVELKRIDGAEVVVSGTVRVAGKVVATIAEIRLVSAEVIDGC
jgi:3-hydroxyacyl-[acyl-carrier-protein] dehydratase